MRTRGDLVRPDLLYVGLLLTTYGLGGYRGFKETDYVPRIPLLKLYEGFPRSFVTSRKLSG
jgi:hypothetical protein